MVELSLDDDDDDDDDETLTLASRKFSYSLTQKIQFINVHFLEQTMCLKMWSLRNREKLRNKEGSTV